MSMSGKDWQLTGGIGLLVVGAAIVFYLAGWTVRVAVDEPPGPLWIAGAAALGLLSGFATGLSKDPGSGKGFVTFVGTGILVPILGGVGALLERTQQMTERSAYSGTQLVVKTTKTVTLPSDGLPHPLAVLGSFFVAFALLAVLGLIAGVLLRKGGAIELMAA